MGNGIIGRLHNSQVVSDEINATMDNLEEMMTGYDPSEREEAVGIYSRLILNFDYRESVDRLHNVERLFMDSDSQVRISAASSFIGFHIDVADSLFYNVSVLPELIKDLGDWHAEDVLRWAADKLIDAGPGMTIEDADAVIEGLRPFLAHPDARVRELSLQLYLIYARFVGCDVAQTEIAVLRSEFIESSDLGIRRMSAHNFGGNAESLALRNISAAQEVFSGDEFPQSVRYGAAAAYITLFEKLGDQAAEEETARLGELAEDTSDNNSPGFAAYVILSELGLM